MVYKSLAENIRTIREKITRAAHRSGRADRDIRLIAVTKTVGLQDIRQAAHEGLRVFGENRVQEARQKIAALREQIPECGIEWHLIGHLQKNKAKHAVQLFDVIHTIDSVDLADEVNRQAERAGKIQKILVQVKLSEEETRHGALEHDVIMVLERMGGLKGIRLEGLMTLPPYFEDPEKTRPYFRKLRDLRDHLTAEGLSLPELSMGMSNDFEVAIEEGSTMVRIGTAIFGERTVCIEKERTFI